MLDEKARKSRKLVGVKRSLELKAPQSQTLFRIEGDDNKLCARFRLKHVISQGHEITNGFDNINSRLSTL